MTGFTVFPAIDLRQGQVVRLVEGDPLKPTHYSADPAETAERWLKAGATWLHVVNLDGAFGESSLANQEALQKILAAATKYNASIQFGGGLRSLEAVDASLEMGVNRVILGTLAIEQPRWVSDLLARWGPERIAVSLDARQGQVQVRGWQEATPLQAGAVACELRRQGLSWLIFTDITRDGLQTGLNLPATIDLARVSGLQVIASGGVRDWDDIQGARQGGLAGAIVGRALYEGAFDPVQLFSDQQEDLC
jgi:phosphoribosylformimino-5-aminoimidazole carboxamide ribotide isomerase